jgi:AcrR family transcriptional regulator
MVAHRERAAVDRAVACPKPARPAARAARDRKAAPRPSQSERRDESRTSLLRAAFELIAARGFRGTSFQAIALRAGYSPSLVSHRFGSKEGLLGELLGAMLHKWAADARALAGEAPSGLPGLVGTAAAHRRALEESPEKIRAMYMLMFESLADAPKLRREFAKLDSASRRNTERIVAPAIAAGEIRSDADAQALSVLFLALLRGITLQWLVDPGSIDLPRVYAALDGLLEHGLGP